MSKQLHVSLEMAEPCELIDLTMDGDQDYELLDLTKDEDFGLLDLRSKYRIIVHD